MEIYSWLRDRMKKLIFLLLSIVIIGVLFFEIETNVRFAFPKKIEILDSSQELIYLKCVEARDKIIHAQTFSSIDNPDVQREVLSARKNQALAECRGLHPAKMVEINQAFEVNIFDLKYRY